MRAKAHLSETRGILQNETKRETEHNLTEGNSEAQHNLKESKTPASPEPDSARQLRAISQSARLAFDFSNRLSQIPPAQTDADRSAFRNLSTWVGGQDNGTGEKALQIAREAIKGDNPPGLFFHRLDNELGYRPRAEREKRLAAEARI